MRQRFAGSLWIGLAIFCPALGFPATVSIGVAPNGSSLGQPVTITATVAPAAGGTVTFFDQQTILGMRPLTGESAALPTGLLMPGSHQLHAVYRDAKGELSTSTVVSFAVTALASPAFNSASPIGSLHAAAIVTGDFDGSGRPGGSCQL